VIKLVATSPKLLFYLWREIMAQAQKRGYIRKTADEQIEEYQNKIKEIKNREIQKAQKILDKKYILIGKALVGAFHDQHITNKAFTMILSKYVSKQSELDSLQEDFDLDPSALLSKEPRGRGRPKGARNRISAAREIMANAETEEDDRETLSLPEKDEAALKEDEAAAKKAVIEKAAAEKEKRAAEVKAAKDKAKAKEEKKAEEEAKLDPPPPAPIAENIVDGDDEDEDNDDSQGNIIDPQLHLEGVENFARRGRLIDRLRTSGVNTLSHLITKSERDFARIPGINTGTVRTCKAILNEMGLGFKK